MSFGMNLGAQMGISRPLSPADVGVRALRVARYKSRHETYRRLLDFPGK